MKILPVILSGGSGTRLWPLSRNSLPKQFLPFFSSHSLFQKTLLRIKSLQNFDLMDPLIICNYDHRFLVRDQLREIDCKHSAIITEPVSKNTAPAVTISALYADKLTKEEVTLVILPSDHLIKDESSFIAYVEESISRAASGSVLTLGLEPQSPHTGYGYIKKGELVINKDSICTFEVDEFIEKPQEQDAKKMILSNEYLWNSGIFVFTDKVFLNLINELSPKILKNCQDALTNSSSNLDFIDLNESNFSKTPSDSIDYAVIEKIDKKKTAVEVVEMNISWTDLGTWSSIWSEFAKDDEGNVKNGDIFTKNTQDSLIFSDKALIATYGIKNLVIVASEDSFLVVDKNESENVKELVDILKSNKKEEALTHKLVYRPWGSFFTLEEGSNYKVKRLTINPHQKISLQKHNKRSEHWVVVKGSARITKGEDIFELNENQSTYIPLGIRHSIENPSNDELELIEVQSGDYLGEDDIQRFEDIYGRQDK